MPAPAANRLPIAELDAFVARLRGDLAAYDSDFALQFALGRKVNSIVADRAKLARLALRTLWFACVGSDSPYALIATGGFGRGELYPHSDIDLLVLTPHPAPADLPERVQRFLAALWDLRYRVGHSARSLPQLREDARADVVLATSLLEARLICGEQARWKEMAPLLAQSIGWPARDYLDAKLAEARERHQRFSDTTFNLEPQIKDGRGGLRDFQSTLWIAQVCCGAASYAAMERKGLLHRDERQRWLQAVDRLRAVRYALHLLAERAEDRLLFEFQPRLASLFGHVAVAGSNAAIEGFMHEYFRATARIDLIGERIIERVRERVLDLPVRRLREGWRIVDGRLESSARRELDGERLHELMDLVIRREDISALGPELAREVERLLGSHGKLLAGVRAKRLLLTLLQTAGSPRRALQIWARYGLLGAVVPAFARISGLMQYDLFHVYTVDRHTLAVVNEVAKLSQDEEGEDLRYAHSVRRRIDQPGLLLLAALFHDIAKGRGGDHSRLGAVEVRRFAQHLALPPADRDLLAFLVRQHLAMSIVAQKQDIQDPVVISRFARLVQEPRQLDYLYLLTVADIRGTNPKLWNGWRARLLRDLHRFTERALRSGEAFRDDGRRRARVRRETMELLRGEGFGRDQVLRLWSGFPAEAFLRQGVDHLRWQTGALLRASPSRIEGRPDGADGPIGLTAVRSIGAQGAREVFVHVPDQTGIFAAIVATLDRLHLLVVGARVLTTPGGWTLDSFQVLDQDQRWTDPVGRNMEIQMRLEMALGESPLKIRLSRRNPSRQQKHFYFAPELRLRPQADAQRSELSLACSDQPGLLATVAQAFYQCGVNVHAARIATFGERVEDVFVLSNAQDQALDEGEAEQLIAAVESALSQSN
ncbi:MAG: [protein-PII] uridylyltransferase [Xanthomonadales bacterium]|nr:[protein-PII] uridylyltransferase [Xanthomonadales bacterium]